MGPPRARLRWLGAPELVRGRSTSDRRMFGELAASDWCDRVVAAQSVGHGRQTTAKRHVGGVWRGVAVAAVGLCYSSVWHFLHGRRGRGVQELQNSAAESDRSAPSSLLLFSCVGIQSRLAGCGFRARGSGSVGICGARECRHLWRRTSVLRRTRPFVRERWRSAAGQRPGRQTPRAEGLPRFLRGTLLALGPLRSTVPRHRVLAATFDGLGERPND
jgi:hypothetical protein